MKDIEDLLKIGIKPTEELNTVERTEVIKKLAMLMSNNINTFKYSENENYMRLFNLNIMYAEFDQADNEIIYGVEETKKAKYKYNGVYYSEDNNILFLTKDYDIENPDEAMFKQVFRYFQSNNLYPKNNLLKILTDYLAYLAVGKKVHKITDDQITISTISDDLDKFSMSLASEIITLCSEAEIVEGTLVDSQDMDLYLANEFTGSIKSFEHEVDTIISLENGKFYDEEKIIIHYIKAQDLLFQSYFDNKVKQLFTVEQIDNQVAKLNEFDKILGIPIKGNNKAFKLYKDKIQAQFFDKYAEARRLSNTQAMVVVKRNPFRDLLRKIVMKFKKNSETL